MLALFRIDQEAVEVADPVVDQTVHFAGESRSLVALAMMMVVMLVAVLAVVVTVLVLAVIVIVIVIVIVVVVLVLMTRVAVLVLVVHGDYVLAEACRCSLIPRREGREAR